MLDDIFKEIVVNINTVITAISTLSAVLITNFFNLRSAKQNLDFMLEKKKSELKLEKIEELYVLFEKWQAALKSIYLTHLSVFVGELSHEQALEKGGNKNHYESEAFQKLKALLHIHFPELKEKYTPIDDARNDISPFLNDPKYSGLTEKEFCEKQDQFDSNCLDFKKALSGYATNL